MSAEKMTDESLIAWLRSCADNAPEPIRQQLSAGFAQAADRLAELTTIQPTESAGGAGLNEPNNTRLR